MNKKAIAILGVIFLLIVGTLGFLIYSRYFGQPEPSDVVVNNGNNNGQPISPTPPANSPTPTTPTKSIFKLTDDQTDGQVVSPVLWFNGEAVNYFDNKGNLYVANLQEENGKLSLTGKKLIGIPTKTNIVKAYWPSQSRDFIVQLKGADDKVMYSYFSYDKESFVDLPGQVTSLDWMPNSTQIMYIWLENGVATLNLANPDGSNYVELSQMWETDDAIFVSPNGDQLLYYETNNTGDTNPINLVTTDGKVWKSLVKSGYNMGVLWSPDGQKFLFGRKDTATQLYQLWVYNLTSGEVKNLNLNTTVDKVVWAKDSNTVYASIPDSGGAGQGNLTVDTFVRLEISSLAKKQYAKGDTAVDGRDLFLNREGDKLFFKNAQDGGLYYLDLAQ